VKGAIHMDNKIVILYSGGADSKLMYEYAKIKGYTNIQLVYFNIGQEYAYKEIATLPDEVEVLDMPWFFSGEQSKEGNASGNIFIPGRNLVFSVLAASKYLPDEVWLGSLCGEDHSVATDKNEIFRQGTTNLLSYVLSPFKKDVLLRFPFVEEGWGKLDIVKWALENNLEDVVLSSSSCMSKEEGQCGQCVVCARLWGIFIQLGIDRKFNRNPLDSLECIKMFKEMLDTEILVRSGEKMESEVHYNKFRRDEIVPALQIVFNTKDLNEIRNSFK
jgi:7-cyano-7-deazaguanine synthase in queuosine biosynthesis